jgi:outer membrane protein OmpA-like peptidoglycan-associated protein
MSKLVIKAIAILLASSLLTACMSLGSLTHKQAKMLKKEGFELTEEGWTLGLPERLLFQFNDAQMQESQRLDLQRLSIQLLKYDLQKMKIIGHTDDIGDAQYNLLLSQKRAETVKDVFVDEGFKPANILTIGRGSTKPLVPNNSDANRATNRRVNIIIIP